MLNTMFTSLSRLKCGHDKIREGINSNMHIFQLSKIWNMCNIHLPQIIGEQTPRIDSISRKNKNCRQVGQVFTMWWAASWEIPNCCRNELLFWWCIAWEACATEIGVKEEKHTIRVASSARAFPAVKGPGRAVWARMWPKKQGWVQARMRFWIFKNKVWIEAFAAPMRGTVSMTERALTT